MDRRAIAFCDPCGYVVFLRERGVLRRIVPKNGILVGNLGVMHLDWRSCAPQDVCASLAPSRDLHSCDDMHAFRRGCHRWLSVWRLRLLIGGMKENRRYLQSASIRLAGGGVFAPMI